MLDGRRLTVLQALVEEYVRTGQPVSSRAVLEASELGVSSATIRNDLSCLEGYGFVEQPHTSAGRVPTRQGYRYYVDHCAPGRLRSATRSRIVSFFSDVSRELDRLLKDTTGLLSELSSYPAVVIGPGLGDQSVVAIYLFPLKAETALAVTIAGSGRVTREVVGLPFAVTEFELAEAEQVITAAYNNRSLAGGATIVANMSSDECGERTLRIVQAVADGLAPTVGSIQDLYVSGTAQLASLWENLSFVHSMLELLERDGALRQLIESDSGTNVRIGTELGVDDVELAVISTDYVAGDYGLGRVGVIGPMRMNYRRTIKIVEEVSDGLGGSLGR